MKALLIVNPVSGKRRITGELVEIISRLEKGGYVTTVHVTERRGDATETARIHGGEYDVIVCCGGDGTLSETANGMIKGGHKTKIGYIPSGTPIPPDRLPHILSAFTARTHPTPATEPGWGW